MPKSANFTDCGNRYMTSLSLISQYNYTGHVKLISPNPATQITYEGCVALCGTGNDWYDWSTASATITTWVLPIIGTLLQAPLESNAFWRTVKAVGRWMGSPMAALAYILWNIEVSGKCALFVDMATPYDAAMPDEDGEFADLRDSFYLLMNFNQYKLKPLISMTKEAEGLLRICLFSKDLRLLGTDKTLPQMRRKLAANLRSNRRRGVVPVFISTLWFLLSVGISIEAAFGQLGDNTQAHDLALGLFMSWFPILILCSIVDRNPVASDDIRRKLNKLVDIVCNSLQDPENRGDFVSSFHDMPEAATMAYWVHKISLQAPLIKNEFFTGFAGQGRTRFHYGAAHAILIDIEKSYIAEHGRGWFMHDERAARASLVLGQVDHGFVWFDGRQFWQISCAVLLVSGTSAGAFILSYFTPTVGLGCRTGGYLIFLVIALTLLLAELAVWWLTSPIRKKEVSFLVRQSSRALSLNDGMFVQSRTVSFPGVARSKASLTWVLNLLERCVLMLVLLLVKLLSGKEKRKWMDRTRSAVESHFTVLRGLTTRQWTERCFFTPLEFINMVWLCYITVAQTTGAFVNCACQTSIWGGGAGYLDFTQWQQTDSPEAARYWILGTVISSVFMGLGMIYIVVEWCLQAHLSTESYRDAMNGLWRVRRFRRFTFWVRYPASLLVVAVNNLAKCIGVRKTRKRKSLVWTKESRHESHIAEAITRSAAEMQNMPFRSLSDPEGGLQQHKS